MIEEVCGFNLFYDTREKDGKHPTKWSDVLELLKDNGSFVENLKTRHRANESSKKSTFIVPVPSLLTLFLFFLTHSLFLFSFSKPRSFSRRGL
jgi:hypothetical protein